MAKNTGVPVIIKKPKKGEHAAHHGGAWKVAYADFVTAMMAFFLLLWLLNVTTDVQKRGIADYFEPTISSKSLSGAGGVLGGMTMGQPGSQSVPLSLPSFTIDKPALRQPNEGDDGDEGGSAGTERTAQDDASIVKAQAAKDGRTLDEAELQRQVAEREEKRFQAAEEALRQAVQEVPELKDLAENLLVDRTEEGLRVQLVDQEKRPMFPLGSAEMNDAARKLVSLVSQVVARLPNKLAITGHTDATPYAFGRRYGNWELSADRANASRREFLNDGLPAERIARVVGTADRDPLIPEDPTSARNRRISVVLLREAKEPAPAAATPRVTQR